MPAGTSRAAALALPGPAGSYEIEHVQLATGGGEQRRDVAEALDVAQPELVAVVGDRPQLTVSPEHIAGRTAAPTAVAIRSASPDKPSSSARLRRLRQHRLLAAEVGRLAAVRQRARVLEQRASADRRRAEQLAAGERGREVAVGLLGTVKQRREPSQPQGDRPERLLCVGDGVVVGVRQQQLVELQSPRCGRRP